MQKTYMRKLFTFSILLFLVAPVASAAVFDAGEEYTLGKDTVIAENFYGAGGNVVFSGTVKEDAIVAGGNVLFNGFVERDAVFVGGTVDSLGEVGEDIRIIGGKVTVGSVVGGDLISVGGDVHVLDGALVSGDVVLVGGSVVFDGMVHKTLRIIGDEVVLNGVVDGNVRVQAGSMIVFGEKAKINGDFRYTARKEIVVPEGVVLGGVVYDTSYGRDANKDILTAFAAAAGIFFLIKLFALLFAGVLSVVFLPRHSRNIVEHALDAFGKHFFVGLVGIIIIPVLSFFLLMTLFGAFIALILMGIYVALCIASAVYAGILLGAVLSKWTQKEIIVNWRWATIGIVLLHFILLVPFIGFATVIIFMFTAFGVLLGVLYDGIWLSRREQSKDMLIVQNITEENNSEQ
jgi:hypothetical protein